MLLHYQRAWRLQIGGYNSLPDVITIPTRKLIAAVTFTCGIEVIECIDIILQSVFSMCKKFVALMDSASTNEHGLTIQREALLKAGCELVREEKEAEPSGTTIEGREELDTLMSFMRAGDTLMVSASTA